MSFPKKSDVKNHLSTRRSKNLLPFRQVNPPNRNSSGVELSDESRNMPTIDALIGSDTDTSAIKKPQA